MQLAQLASVDANPLPLGNLSTDAVLSTDVQGVLIKLGLLDPPADGKFGPVSTWALAAFCRAAGLSLANGLTQAVARALCDPGAGQFFPLNPRDDFAGRIVKAMLRRGHWIARHPTCRNIVYIEGCNPGGTRNDNLPNAFNDLRVVFAVDAAGKPGILGQWKGTTEPGTYYTLHPLDPRGAARIAFGQYKAWAVGEHRGGSNVGHEALVQVADIKIYRDLNQDFKRNDQTYAGQFGVNQHWGYNLPDDDMKNASAGCLVGQRVDEHKVFMSLVKEDPRYAASHAYRFITTVMPYGALDGSD